MSLRVSTAAVAAPAPGQTRSTYTGWHTPDSVVCWASVTKVFVAAACRALVAAGALTWSTTVGDLTGGRSDLTVEELVAHTSGLPRLMPHQMREWRDPYVGWTADRFDAEAMARLDDIVNPVARGLHEYSNLGYAVLARALEVGTGTPWIDLVREHVVEPLGVAGGAVKVGAPVTSGGALCALSIWGRPLEEYDVSTGPFSGSGGLCSTVPVLADLFARAFDQGSALLPGEGPHAWPGDGPRWIYRGALMRTGSALVVDTTTRAVAVSHTSGGLFPDRHAIRALERLLDAQAT